MEPFRISPSEAYRLAKDGNAILVCAYPDEETCSKMCLRGAITRTEFQDRLPDFKKGQEIIFYCAWPGEATSAGQAMKYMMNGYTNVKFLDGGIEAWKKAGYEIVGKP
jgi:rhodanese-related sulfurtransferase